MRDDEASRTAGKLGSSVHKAICRARDVSRTDSGATWAKTIGVASNHLASVAVGSRISVAVAPAGATSARPMIRGRHHRDVDFLYEDELDVSQKAGMVDVRPAFWFAEEDGVKFVQHRVWMDRADIAKLFREDAVV